MKKEELRQDPVRTFIVNSVNYLTSNSNKVFIVLAAFLFIVGIFSYYSHLDKIKIEKSVRLAGRAQSSFINGNIEEATVKFERVLKEFPNTLGASQALVYLLKISMLSDDNPMYSNYLNSNFYDINDSYISSSIFRMKSNYENDNLNYDKSIEYLDKVDNLNSYSLSSISTHIDLINLYIIKEDYIKAEMQLNQVLKTKDLSFNDKNNLEEMLSFVNQKMNI